MALSPLPSPPDYTFTRHALSKYFPDVHKRSYIEGIRINITGSGTYTSSINFTFPAILRKIAVVSSGSFDGDLFHLSGSNRTAAYATNILIPPNNLGLILPLEVQEKFTGSSNNIYLTFIPTGSALNKIYWYAHFLRD